jgi:hypothetical protein
MVQELSVMTIHITYLMRGGMTQEHTHVMRRMHLEMI